MVELVMMVITAFVSNGILIVVIGYSKGLCSVSDCYTDIDLC